MNKKITYIASTLLLTTLLFVSCTNIFSHKNSVSSKSDADGKTYLCLKVNNSREASRSLAPKNTQPFDITAFTDFSLIGKLEGEEGKTLFEADTYDDIPQKIEIMSGQWTFYLYAKYNNIEFTADQTLYILSGQQNNITLTLRPFEQFGGCDISFTLTDSVVSKVEVTLKRSSDGEIILDKSPLQISEKNGAKTVTLKRSMAVEEERLTSGRYYAKFDFYTGEGGSKGYALLNEYESFLIITDAFTTSANISLDFNELYTITYKYMTDEGAEVELVDAENFALASNSFIPFYYSKGSEITLPEAKQANKVFLGWKKQASEEYISEIKAKDQTNITLVAQIAEPVLYVSEDGDDSIDSNDKGFTSANPLKTIEAACKQLKQFCESDFDWTIYINGEVTGIPTGSGNSSTYGPIIIFDEENEEYGITPDHAKSITITGMNGRGADGSILAGTEDTSHNIIEPVDILNRGSPVSGRTSPVLSINTTVPVTITNLKITGGNGENGGGIFIKEGATVSLGDGVLITQNRSIRGGAIFNQGTLFIYGTAILGKIDATDYASDDSSKNDTNSSYGGGIYNGDTAATVANTKIIAKLYLGYKLSDDGVTPVKEELKGGIYYCWANSGGGIYNAIKSLVYLDSGTIQYNGVKNYGGGLYNNDASRLEMTGGKIIKNSASQTSSVMYGGGVCNDYLNSVFIMSAGLINENRAWCTGTGTSNGKGGGVFNGGKMFMYGTAVIGNKDASASATEASCGNKANIGGGIYNSYGTDQRGYLYIGYEPDADGITPKEADFSGGIYNNYSKDNSNGNNKDGGGAIYSTAFPPNYGDVRIAKGTIAYNSTEDYGGAYCGKEITITGGSILNNSAGKKGGAIYLKDNTTSTLSIGGSVQIPYTGTEETGYQNDICPSVYSKTYFTKIKILSALTNHSASNQLRITPENYHEGIQLITIDSAAETDYATELPEFVLTPEIHTEYNTRADWEFNDSGELHSTIPFADITVAFSDPDINVSVKYNNTYDAGEGLIQGTRNVIFTADPGYAYTWMLDDEIITNTEASDDAVAIISDKSNGTNNVLKINTLKLIHGGIYDVYLEAEKAGIKYSYMAQMKIQNY